MKKFFNRITTICLLALSSASWSADEIHYLSIESTHQHVENSHFYFNKGNPSKPYLYEDFLSSDDYKVDLAHFIEKVPEASHLKNIKIYADRRLQSEVIGNQLNFSIGHEMLTRFDSNNHRNMMLLEWAIDEMRRLGLTPGQPLTAHQKKSLKHIIVWPELHTIAGVRVVFPRVYVTQAAADEFRGATSSIIAGKVIWNTDELELGLGSVIHGRDGVSINSVNVNSNGGRIESTHGDTTIKASGLIRSNNGVIKGNNVTVEGTDVVINNRDGSNGVQARLDAALKARNNIFMSTGVRSGCNTDIEAGNHAVFYANQETDVEFKSVPNGYSQITKTTHTNTQIEAGCNVNIHAGGQIRGLPNPDDPTKPTHAVLDVKAGSQSAFEDAFFSQFEGPADTPVPTAKGSISVSGDKGVYISGVTDVTKTHTETEKTKSGMLSSETKKTVKDEVQTDFQGSSFTANNGDVSIKSDKGEVEIIGSDIEGEKVTIHADKDVRILSAKNIYQCSSYTLTKKKGLGSANYNVKYGYTGDRRKQTNENCSKESLVETNIDATTEINITSNQNVEIRSSKLKAEHINIKATDKVSFTLHKLKDTYNKSTSSRDLYWQESVNKGHTKEHATYNKIDGELTVEAKEVKVQVKEDDLKGNGKFYVAGMEIKLESDDNLHDRLQELGSLPGMGWIQTVSQHENVNIAPVELAYDSWKKTQSGLTPEGAVIVAVAVSVATSGAGAAALNSAFGAGTGTVVTTTAAGATITHTTMYGIVANAGLSTLASKAATSLINNQGDVIAVFNELQRDENVKSIVAGMITAGVTHGFLGQLGASQEALQASSALERFNAHAQNAILSSSVRLVINAGVYGSDIRKGFMPAMKEAAVDALGATLANEIGSAYVTYKTENGRDALSYLTHKVLHGVLGCGLAQAKEGECGAGALAAVTTEVYLDQKKYDLASLTHELIDEESDLGQRLRSDDKATRLAARAEVETLVNNYSKAFINEDQLKSLAKLGSTFMVMAAGYDAHNMNLAGDISANAADNNAFWFVAIAIFKAVDAGMAIYDSYQLVQELTSEDTTEERKREIAQELFENGLLSIGGGRSVKKLLDVVEEKLGISKETLLNKIKDLLPNKGPKLETAGGPRLDGRDHDTDPNMYSGNSNSNTGSNRTGETPNNSTSDRPKGGAERANKFSINWPKASLKDAVKKFSGDNPIITRTDKGKKIYTNRETGIQVVQDLNGNYFRIYDPKINGKRAYLDLNGEIPNNKVLDNGKLAGRSQGEYNQVTHFNIIED